MNAAGLTRSVINAILPARFRPQPPLRHDVQQTVTDHGGQRDRPALRGASILAGRVARGACRPRGGIGGVDAGNPTPHLCTRYWQMTPP